MAVHFTDHDSSLIDSSHGPFYSSRFHIFLSIILRVWGILRNSHNYLLRLMRAVKINLMPDKLTDKRFYDYQVAEATLIAIIRAPVPSSTLFFMIYDFNKHVRSAYLVPRTGSQDCL